jgi:hypothetical protein
MVKVNTVSLLAFVSDGQMSTDGEAFSFVKKD